MRGSSTELSWLHAGLLQDLRTALGDVAQAPLPGLPGAPSSGLSLGSVLESVANITGTAGATERAIERTGDALATGNFTEVRRCSLNLTWQRPQLCGIAAGFPLRCPFHKLNLIWHGAGMLCHMQASHQTTSCASLAHSDILRAAPAVPNDCPYVTPDMR